MADDFTNHIREGESSPLYFSNQQHLYNHFRSLQIADLLAYIRNSNQAQQLASEVLRLKLKEQSAQIRLWRKLTREREVHNKRMGASA